MLKILMKFFKFCNEENRKKFYKSIALGVIDAIFAGMKIPAAYFAIDALHAPSSPLSLHACSMDSGIAVSGCLYFGM